MPNFDFDSVEASDGSFKPFCAGGYVCKVTEAYDDEGRQEVGLVFDVDEGEFSGEFSRPFWQGKPKWRHAVTLDLAQPTGRTKARLQAFCDSNPGFDAFAAYKADKWELFTGKRIGLVFRDVESVYEGKIYTDQRVYLALPVDKVRKGEFTVPDKVLAQGPEADAARAAEAGAAAPADPYGEFIPF